MTITITKRLEFDAGHRIMGHESKCRSPHGHRWVAEIEVVAEKLDAIGRVVDFSCIKRDVGNWIDEHWDHTMILNRKDAVLIDAIMTLDASEPNIIRMPYLMDENPTSENLAKELYYVAETLLSKHSVHVVSVTIWETPTSKATYCEIRRTV